MIVLFRHDEPTHRFGNLMNHQRVHVFLKSELRENKVHGGLVRVIDKHSWRYYTSSVEAIRIRAQTFNSERTQHDSDSGTR